MIIRMILLPVYIILVAIRLVFGIVIRMADWLFYLLGGLLLLVTVLSYYFGLETGESLKSMVISSGILFIIPQAASLLEGVLEFCTMILGDKIGGR